MVNEYAANIQPRKNFDTYEFNQKLTATEKFASIYVTDLPNGQKSYRVFIYDYKEVINRKKALNASIDTTDQTIYKKVDKKATILGGDNQFVAVCKKFDTKKAKKSGRWVVKCVVEKNGRLSNFEVAKSLGKEFDKQAIDVLKKWLTFMPAVKDGKQVRTAIYIPFYYQNNRLRDK